MIGGLDGETGPGIGEMGDGGTTIGGLAGEIDGEGGEPPGDGVVGGDGTTTGGRGLGVTERPHPNDAQFTGGKDKKAAHCPGDLCAGLVGIQLRRSSTPGKPIHTGGSPVKKL